MNYRVIVTQRAERDMQEMAAWWANAHSPEQADHWLSNFATRLESLSQFPSRCPLAAESDEFPFELRELHYGVGRRSTHRALFNIADDVVLVFAVRHIAQDRLQVDDLSG
ncbi:MAG TPA: type II toxin-antitoxin system RelE/ParE family toxin [Pirellulales bacterium]|nr:type II toxin-antitoxin system RelE/ParE family toxin [Pirellulales bacterium]